MQSMIDKKQSSPSFTPIIYYEREQDFEKLMTKQKGMGEFQ